jgi:hypothetical protein
MPREQATPFVLRSHARRCLPLLAAGSLSDLDRTMKPQHSASPRPLEQVYLVERDAGLLCRILGLYASRGIDVLRAEYAYAAQDFMTLKVRVADDSEGSTEVVRVLIDKAASFVGVLAAGEQPAALQSVA